MRTSLWNSFPLRVIRRYADNDGGTWSTAIAWNALIAIIPIMVVALGGLGLVLHGRGVQNQLQTVFGGTQARSIVATTLTNARETSATFSVAGLLGLLWRGASLFSAVDKGIARMYGRASRDFVDQRRMACGMIIVFTALLIPLILSASFVALLRSLDVRPSRFMSDLFPVIQFVIGWMDAVLIFAAIYHIVPKRKTAVADILPGAVVAGFCLELITLSFPAYIRFSNELSTYGVLIGLVFLLLAYFFLVGLITMLGCCVNVEREAQRVVVAAKAQ